MTMKVELPHGLLSLENVHLSAIRQGLSAPKTPLSERALSTRYIFICYTNRCGSNYLGQVMSGDGYLNQAGEYFNGSTVIDVSKHYKFADFIEFFNFLPEHVGKSGFIVSKLALTHLVVLLEMGVFEDIVDRSTFIVVERANKLDQAISLSIAAQSGQWSHDQTAIISSDCLKFDYNELHSHILGFASEHHLFDQFFGLNGIVPLKTNYEALTLDPELILKQITSFTGLKLQYVNSTKGLKQQSSGLNAVWRTRYLSEHAIRQGVVPRVTSRLQSSNLDGQALKPCVSTKEQTELGPFMEELKGAHYLDFMKDLHQGMRPRTYLEIGTRSGDSLAIAQCASIAIDPAFAVTANVIGQKSICLFYQQASDDFFRDHQPMRLLGGSIDFAFLDGLHLFEFLLRDFINTERNCRPDSLIAMHDCIPGDVYMADRKDEPERRKAMGSKSSWWTGDVWKIAPILRRWRPDVSLVAVDCMPTGLLFATNLDPSSATLTSHYEEIISEFANVDLQKYGIQRLYADLQIERSAMARLPVPGWRPALQEVGA